MWYKNKINGIDNGEYIYNICYNLSRMPTLLGMHFRSAVSNQKKKCNLSVYF